MQSVSEKIRELREAKNLSQKKLAEIAGVSQPTIYNVEHGKVDNITLSIGKNIAKALGVSFAELFEIETPGTGTSEASAELEQLRNLVINYENEIKVYQDRLTDKETIIKSLKTEKKLFKENVIRSIDVMYEPEVTEIRNKLKNCSDQTEKLTLETKLQKIIEAKKRMLKNYMYVGFLLEEDLANYYEQLGEHYKSVNLIWEGELSESKKEFYKLLDQMWEKDQKSNL